MNILYYDCFCGISGDMNLAALLDIGVDEAHLRQELSKLGLNEEFELQIKKDSKMGIGGTRVDVVLRDEVRDYSHSNHPSHHENHAEHHHGTRTYKDIKAIIEQSTLDKCVKHKSITMFESIAKAEAKVHQKPMEEVHFHEVGAVDSIVDIVGAAVCLNYLKVDQIVASPVQVGGGFVKCAHGVFPVPAPATAELLKGVPMRVGLVPYETTTPTGAAVLSVNVNSFTEKMEFTVTKIGYGIGHKDFEVPNVLRVFLGQAVSSEQREGQFLLETNIDDMNPELFGYVEERLISQGALDVFKTPIIMKKGRFATKLSILVSEKKEQDVLDVLFQETTTIGVRKFPVEKIMMDRQFETVTTRYGEITIKNAYYHGQKVKCKPEYEDCRRIAKESGVPINEVYHEVSKEIEAQKE
jgi:uncharacterized protein (TIGR00299 family) protein